MFFLGFFFQLHVRLSYINNHIKILQWVIILLLNIGNLIIQNENWNKLTMTRCFFRLYLALEIHNYMYQTYKIPVYEFRLHISLASFVKINNYEWAKCNVIMEEFSYSNILDVWNMFKNMVLAIEELHLFTATLNFIPQIKKLIE